ncbi:MAG TPA: sulfatase-like hydrolase/transferase [Thermoanaerobaculia bacterium]|nr:sulfatase-like hydrolase/transferase [Thermoanaerobaculia bacterium]
MSRIPVHRTRLAAALAVLLAVALLPGCRRPAGGGAGGAEGPFRGAPVVLISIDTLRSDHLPAYGYRAVDTPAIDRLRRDGVLFARAYSHVPLTLPSHVSILSGELPAVTGVRDNVGYHYDEARWPSLAAELRRAGYATGGFVSAYVLRGETGVSAGFDTWDDDVHRRFNEVLGNSQRAGSETVVAAIRWLRTLGDRPFFLFVHLYDPHSPYAPPAPFAGRYALPYDGEIAAADAAVGELLAELERSGRYEGAIVALLSDHGEGLGDHGEQEHGVLLYREALQVPLLLKLPGRRRAGERVEAPAQLVDVFPTLLAVAGVRRQGSVPLSGRSLLAPPPAAARDLYAETYYQRLHFGWSELASVIRDRYHYLHGPAPQLFDLVADPGERRDVLGDQRRVYAELRRVAEASARELQGPAAADAETRQRLAALGYAASTARVGPGEALPDPRLLVQTLAQLQHGLVLVEQQRFSEAVPVLQHIVAQSPRMVDAWEQLGNALQGSDRLEEALDAYQHALRASVGASHVAAAAGGVLLALGRADEAKAHAQLALATSPSLAHDLLARIALAGGDLPAAEREARAAIAAGEQVAPQLTLAQVQVKAGRIEEAAATVEQAAAEVRRQGGAQRVQGLEQLRGDIFARQGRATEAEAAFRAEIAAYPRNLRAWSGLALLYAAAGQAEEAAATLRRMVEQSGDSPSAYAEAVRTLRALGDPVDAAALLRHALALHPRSSELHSLRG